MRDQHGQALVFAVVLMGIAAVCVAGVREATERLLLEVQDQRVGEAAAASAGAAVADIKAQREVALGRDLERSEVAALAASAEALAAARSAGGRIAALHGRGAPEDVSIRAFGYELEVRVRLAGREHVALLVAAP